MTTAAASGRRLVRPTVDSPRRHEKITSPNYTLRLSAPQGVQRVEISIDAVAWQYCRQAAGRWWYDWTGYGSGRHEVVARMLTREGMFITSAPHTVVVEIASQAPAAARL